MLVGLYLPDSANFKGVWFYELGKVTFIWMFGKKPVCSFCVLGLNIKLEFFYYKAIGEFREINSVYVWKFIC